MPEPYNKFSSDYIILYPLTKKILHLFKNINPNIITLINLYISIFITIFIFLYIRNPNFQIKTYILLLLIIRPFLDALDGAIARKYNKCTTFGAKFDFYTDLIYYSLIFLLFLYHQNFTIVLFMIIINIGHITQNNSLYIFIHDNTLLLSTLFSFYFAFTF
jgi:phosphatidylglycerophosphate synthase